MSQATTGVAGASIEVIDVVKRFGAFTAVDHASLQVRPGEVVGLLGANGAGKTTIMRMVLGLLRPDSGEVLLMGEAPSKATRNRIGYVPQGLGLYEDLTIGENLHFVARAFGGAVHAPTDAGVNGALSMTVASAPLGLRRRTAFAAALSHDPELLILDEPTSGVDPLARASLWETIRDASAHGAAVLVSTHYMEEAQNCDRLIVMRDGAVVARGTASEIVGNRQVVVVRSSDLIAAFAALEAAAIECLMTSDNLRVTGANESEVQLLLRAAAVDAQVSLDRASFEEAFVQLVSGPANSPSDAPA